MLPREQARAGTLYGYELPGGLVVPDPASRRQPDGVHGPSAVVDPRSYSWRDDGWNGRPWHEAVIHELHVGAFDRDGDFDCVRRHLDHLERLGVTALELLPVADFAGRRGWGYDGVLQFAPAGAYGPPESLKRLVDEAHQRGLMMLLDVVYNHFGPDGNYIWVHSPGFFDRRRHTPWGAGIDFRRREVRDFFIHNALYWLEEFRFDGLRLDAVDRIEDESQPHILDELAQTVRRRLEPERSIHLVLENDRNQAHRLIRDPDTGRPVYYTAQWNDDLHHPLHRLLTGENAGFFANYPNHPRDWVARALTEGFGYQGQPSPYHGGRLRGEPSAHLPPQAFIGFLQNHDQIGNRPLGERLGRLAPPDALRAAAALVLLAPHVPMLFMGEEWNSSSPFVFFCDFDQALGEAVRKGRLHGFRHFRWPMTRALAQAVPVPNAPSTLESCRLDWEELREPDHAEWLAYHASLLATRRRELMPRFAGMSGHAGCWSSWGRTGFRISWVLGDGSRLTVLANLGATEEKGCPSPIGDVLFSTEKGLERRAAEGCLPPWSVLWTLTDTLPT